MPPPTQRLLSQKSSQTLKRPRVYVYPFPPAFANASNLWAAAGLDEQGASLYFQGRRHDFPGSYFQIAYGAKGPYHFHSKWRHAKDGLRWTPAWPLFSEELQTGNIDGSTCQFMRQPSQHITGLVLHRALTHWPKLVDDPSQAELFFVPDHACRRGRGAGKMIAATSSTRPHETASLRAGPRPPPQKRSTSSGASAAPRASSGGTWTGQ